MINVTCVRLGSYRKFNKGLKGQFIRTFNDLYELSTWLLKAHPTVCLVKASEELTPDQIRWLDNRHRTYSRRIHRQY